MYIQVHVYYMCIVHLRLLHPDLQSHRYISSNLGGAGSKSVVISNSFESFSFHLHSVTVLQVHCCLSNHSFGKVSRRLWYFAAADVGSRICINWFWFFKVHHNIFCTAQNQHYHWLSHCTVDPVLPVQLLLYILMKLLWRMSKLAHGIRCLSLSL